METSPSPANSDLQFDKADFNQDKPSQIICQFCKKEILDSYYDINQKITCLTCKEKLDKAISSRYSVKKLAKAFLAGTGAALVGAGIYYAVLKLTGYEFGLIAVVVGFMVGQAVRWGSGRKGGWAYQALAMFLTYNAIVLTYLPFIIEDFQNKLKVNQTSASAPASVSTTDVTPVSASVAIATPIAGETVPLSAANTSLSPASTPVVSDSPQNKKAVPLDKLILGLASLLALAYALPFLAGFKNILGLVIIGFALYQAWKMNQRVKVIINGPFKVGPPKV